MHASHASEDRRFALFTQGYEMTSMFSKYAGNIAFSIVFAHYRLSIE